VLATRFLLLRHQSFKPIREDAIDRRQIPTFLGVGVGITRSSDLNCHLITPSFFARPAEFGSYHRSGFKDIGENASQLINYSSKLGFGRLGFEWIFGKAYNEEWNL
jgi:hypothetical protein